MEDLIKNLVRLIDVKSIVTILLTVAFIVLCFMQLLTPEFTTIYTMVMGFYFGTQSKKAQVDHKE